MIVVDVGAHTWPPEESVPKLVARFEPDLLLAFDPHPDFPEGIERFGRALVVRRRAALWTHDGAAHLRVDGMCSHVAPRNRREALRAVEAVDVGSLLNALPRSDPLVLKLDAEFAEVPLLERVVALGGDGRLSRVLVEWHDGNPLLADRIDAAVPDYVARKERLLKGLRCPVENW